MTGGELRGRLSRSGLPVFVLRRLAQAVVVIFVSMFLYHVGIALMIHSRTGVPFSALFSFGGFFDYIGDLATGDLGYDGFQDNRLVIDRLTEATWHTFRLAVLALALQLTLGVIAGVIAAVTHRPFVDTLVTVVSVILLSTPVLVVGILLKNTFAGAELFGVQIFAEVPTRFTEEPAWLAQVVLPAATIAVAEVGFIARLARTSMLEVLTADYIRTARSKGISDRRVIWKHTLRNALVPVLSYATVVLGIFLGGTFVVEVLFDYQGLGNRLFMAFKQMNVPMLKAGVVYLTAMFMLLSALMDILCRWLDPRVQLT